MNSVYLALGKSGYSCNNSAITAVLGASSHSEGSNRNTKQLERQHHNTRCWHQNTDNKDGRKRMKINLIVKKDEDPHPEDSVQISSNAFLVIGDFNDGVGSLSVQVTKSLFKKHKAKLELALDAMVTKIEMELRDGILIKHRLKKARTFKMHSKKQLEIVIEMSSSLETISYAKDLQNILDLENNTDQIPHEKQQDTGQNLGIPKETVENYILGLAKRD